MPERTRSPISALVQSSQLAIDRPLVSNGSAPALAAAILPGVHIFLLFPVAHRQTVVLPLAPLVLDEGAVELLAHDFFCERILRKRVDRRAESLRKTMNG